MTDPTMALTHAIAGLTIGPGGEQLRGTVQPFQNFNPETDCQQLRQAMRGAGELMASLGALSIFS